MRSVLLPCLLLTLLTGDLPAQVPAMDSVWLLDMPEYVVTATRSERRLSQVTVPTLIVNATAIRMAGHIRLNEVLQEQTGLFLTAGAGSSAVGGGIFGNGVQIQGFAPDYTLILLDGEPLIGRQGGVIDLSRFAVGNIRRLEIIKGPSSALYGSEAMGGVINIITEQRRKNYVSGGLRYGQFGTADLYAASNINTDRSTLYLFGNFNRSDGYDLQPERPENTLDPYHNASMQLKWTYRLNDRTRLVWNNRFFYGVQTSEFALNAPTINVHGQGRTTDININPTINHLFHDRLKTSLRLYTSLYRYEQYLDLVGSEEPYYDDNFQHVFYRLENQTDWDWGDGQQLVVGGGYNLQQVETIRYRTVQSQHLGYAFIQNEWQPDDRWTLIPGLRYDLHSDYANRLTPKLSMQYRASNRLNINFSYGSGFKAPDFRQLYLYYVNPAAQGYRVYGASEFSVAELEQQKDEGLIAHILPEAYLIDELRPEISHGFNLGGNYAFRALPLKADLNVFYNSVRDLINYIPVATLQNNALVFSYLNINRAYTGGVEVNLSGTLLSHLEWGAGYQYLITGDRDVVRRLRNGEVFGRNSPQGAARRMSLSDYTGLLGRSPHMLNARLLYEDPDTGWGGTIRVIYRSRWGVVDLDGNGFANMPEEFARGFTMLNMSLQKTFSKKITVQLNANNILNHIDAVNTPHLPGRHFQAALHWNFLN